LSQEFLISRSRCSSGRWRNWSLPRLGPGDESFSNSEFVSPAPLTVNLWRPAPHLIRPAGVDRIAVMRPEVDHTSDKNGFPKVSSTRPATGDRIGIGHLDYLVEWNVNLITHRCRRHCGDPSDWCYVPEEEDTLRPHGTTNFRSISCLWNTENPRHPAILAWVESYSTI